MKSRFGASLTIALAAFLANSAFAAELPEVKASASNRVPACVTPERLTAYLQTRNPRLDPRFEHVAEEYKRNGEALGIRWDIAYFQMILETGALRFGGDVRASQNNFAGLGASGGGAHGESFPDVSTGVKAHLQHLLMYAGEHIDDPVADRTRKVQEWGVLTDWQKSIEGPMTFTLVAKQWAPTSRNYVRDISTITDGFYSAYCGGDDPGAPQTQEAKADTPKAKAKTEVAAADDAGGSEAPAAAPDKKAPGAEIAQRNIEEERNQGAPLKALGANMLGSIGQGAKAAGTKPVETAAVAPAATTAEDAPPVTLLNAKTDPAPAATAEPPPASKAATDTKKADAKAPDTKAPDTKASSAKVADAKKADAKAKPKADAPAARAESSPAAKAETATAAKPDAAANAPATNIQTAALGSAATQLKAPPAKGGKCKVWTASYGGQRSVIIKANGNGTVNYTVLDVTEANEKREVDAYIAAYAKGGEKVATFPNQNKALTKAFELCPEG